MRSHEATELMGPSGTDLAAHGDEVEIGDKAILVSRTDINGNLTYANGQFLDVSGYGWNELKGQPHSISRHPDVPKAVFADMWATIQAGHPWDGILKNRTRDGRFYWVTTNVTPLFEEGKLSGYVSIRIKAPPGKIKLAEELYADLNSSRPTFRLEEGRVLPTSFVPRIKRMAQSLKAGSFGSLLLLCAAILTSILSGMPPLAQTLIIVLLAGVGCLGAIQYRAVTQIAKRFGHHFETLAVSNVHHEIPRENLAEFTATSRLLRAMRARLAVTEVERAEFSARAQDLLRREMMTLTEVLEGEIKATVVDIANQSIKLNGSAGHLSRIAQELITISDKVQESIQITASNVEQVANRSVELEEASDLILHQIANSADLAGTAKDRVDAASAQVSSLTDAAGRIGNVVNIIRSIAGQTRMLALNATIEAARAGEMGKGFTVVASEVKGLAQQTEEGIGNVNSQAEAITSTTRDTVTTVEAVVDAIRDMAAISNTVRETASQQRQATGEIKTSAKEAAEHTHSVAHQVTDLISDIQSVETTASRVTDLAAMVNRDINALQQRINIVLRTSYSNRRNAGRVPTAIKFSAELGGTRFDGYTGDISALGALLVVTGVSIQEGAKGWIELDGVGRLEANFMTDSALGLHISFGELTTDQKRRIDDKIAAITAEDEPFIRMTTEVAQQAGAALEAAVNSRTITLDELFSIDYDVIPRSNPFQYMTGHTKLAQSAFPALIEPPLSRDQRIVFCCVTDRSGYIAAHNAKVSQPQRPDDPVWNAANCRNMRIFDDRAGMLAAKNSQPYLVQTYPRDMGGGQYMMLKEIDAPVIVNGKHWGAVRLAVRLV